MSIIRGKRPETFFYTVSKDISEDTSLSWKARGLLIYLLGKPDHWSVVIADLINQTSESASPTGRDGVYAILGELVMAGYLVRRDQRTQDGTFCGKDYIVQEKPLTPNPEADKPLAANTTLVKKEKAASTDFPVKNEIPGSSKNRKASTGHVTLRAYVEANPEANWAPEDGKARKHLRDSGIPEQWIAYQLRSFQDRYMDDDKKYKNWVATFANAVVGDWGKLWYFDQKSSAWALTSHGMAYKIKVEGASS